MCACVWGMVVCVWGVVVCGRVWGGYETVHGMVTTSYMFSSVSLIGLNQTGIDQKKQMTNRQYDLVEMICPKFTNRHLSLNMYMYVHIKISSFLCQKLRKCMIFGKNALKSFFFVDK